MNKVEGYKNMNILNLKILENTPLHTLIASGITKVEDYWNSSKEMLIDWVAIRGGANDWAIYYQLSNKNWNSQQIVRQGEKMHNRDSIAKCICCDEETLNLYRD